MIGGKLKHDETLIQGAIREAKEETGLDVAFDHFCGLCHEHVKEKGAIKHSLLLFVCKMHPAGGALAQSNEGEVRWFDLASIDAQKVVPSDVWMIKNMLDKKVYLPFSTMDETAQNVYEFSADVH